MTRPWYVFCTCAFGLFLLAGCGSGKSSVEGTVTFDGAPVDGGAIIFRPEGAAKESQLGGAQILEGKYVIDSAKGLPPGKYRVEILWKKKTGKQIPNKSDAGTTVEETKQVIPTRYNSATELSADIKSGSNSAVNFDLKSGGPVDSGTPGATKVKAAGD
jgi:hypothetical protein